MEKEKLNDRLEIRLSTQEKNTIKMLAKMYAAGNMSAYIVDRVLYTNRRIIKPENFDLSKRRIKKGDPKVPKRTEKQIDKSRSS